MTNKIIIFLAIDDDTLISELQPLIDKSKYRIESYNSEIECIQNLDLNPDILLIDYHFNNNLNTKEKNSVTIIEKIKEKKLDTKIFMFSERESAKLYLDIIENKI